MSMIQFTWRWMNEWVNEFINHTPYRAFQWQLQEKILQIINKFKLTYTT